MLVAIGFSILAGAMFVVAVVTDRAMGNSSGTSRRILAEQETLKQLTRMSNALERAATSAYLFYQTGDDLAWRDYADNIGEAGDVFQRLPDLTATLKVRQSAVDSLQVAEPALEARLTDLVLRRRLNPDLPRPRSDSLNPLPAAHAVSAAILDLTNEVSATIYVASLRAAEAEDNLRRMIRLGQASAILLLALLIVMLWKDHRARTRLVRSLYRSSVESEDRYRRLVEAAPVGICLHDGTTLEYANRALLDLLGAATEADLIEPASEATQGVLSGAQRTLLAIGADHRVRVTLDCAGGRSVRAEVVGMPVGDGGRQAILAIVLDISERERMETELRAQQAFLRQVLDAVPSMVFAQDPEGRFTLVNRAMADWSGRTPAELEGKQVIEVDPRSGERPERNDSQGIVSFEEPLLHETSGTKHWFHTAHVPFAVTSDSRRHLLVVRTDVTERKQLEVQFLQAQKMEAVGRLAGGVAHDFNNLLTAVLGSAELLQEDQALNESAQSDLALIVDAALRARDLTRQLLAFSRQQILELKVLDVNDIVGGIHRMLQRLIGEDIECRAVLGSSLGAVEADAGQLEQVIVNLAVNARDAMPNGGTVSIETRQVEHSSEYAKDHPSMQPGRYVMLAVSDTGVGMDAATKAQIFEPFFTTKEVGRGTGLGLSTVYGIVKQIGGHIYVYSELGHGTTFKIYMPVVDTAPAKAAAPAPMSGLHRGTETILVVEDEETVRATLTRVLERCGYRVLVAETPERALALNAETPEAIDLLLTDVVMPGMNGRAVAQAITEGRPTTKVLFISGYTDDFIVHQGILDEGVTFLQKPFLPSALARKVRDTLDARLAPIRR